MATVKLPLREQLILLDDYLHPLFGARVNFGESAFLDLKTKLGEFREGFGDDGRSYLADRLLTLSTRTLPPDTLLRYDDNIRRHLGKINAARAVDQRITLKYFQHLALFYTEHVLERVFTNPYDFCADLNKLIDQRNQTLSDYRRTPIPKFQPSDLQKLAYWMATGSGKTLLMHINLHQILHYAQLGQVSGQVGAPGSRPRFDNVLLITPPGDGLSAQHAAELDASGIPNVRFRPAMQNVSPGTVTIIEISKLTTGRTGPNTANVAQFGTNNLLLVDEGHRGSSGDTWMGFRDQLAKDGFTFEYSATFGEALNRGSKASDVDSRLEYGKSIVFDYSYRYFHGDGYGKDYNILNLPKSYGDQERDVLLLGNLLSFYEQVTLFAAHKETLRGYNIEHPLLVFVGHTVQTGKKQSELNKSDKTSLSDVLEILRFLHRAVQNRDGWTKRAIDKIIHGESGLTDTRGQDIFADRLRTIRTHSSMVIFQELLRQLFHTTASAPLHLSNLKSAAGEISLRVGATNQPFGVINIGDDANFLNMAAKSGLDLVIDADDAFRGSLFNTINSPVSTVNILVGAKKFTEGWSSWRVSSMGLLNVGKSEGSEIIQMFGRGVRLLGFQRSLKRSSALEGAHPSVIEPLETLNIFSVHGSYLATFRDALQREDIIDGWHEVEIPLQHTLWDAMQAEEEPTPLYTLQIPEGLAFDQQPTFSLPPDGTYPRIELSARVQVESSLDGDAPDFSATDQKQTIPDWLIETLNWNAIDLELRVWRRERNFRNMVFAQEQLKQLITDGHYELLAPDYLVQPTTYQGLRQVEQIVLTILKKYIEQSYNHQRQAWEAQHFDYVPLNKRMANMQPVTLPNGAPGVVVKVNRRNQEMIQEVEALVAQGTDIYGKTLQLPPTIYFGQHLYQPLLAQGYFTNTGFQSEGQIKSTPVGLNEGEVRFVRDLAEQVAHRPEILDGKQLYLLRNLSRGKGIGFFQASNFYPDFMLWLVEAQRQKLIFIDPKGLSHVRKFSDDKVQLFNTLQNEIRPAVQPAIEISLDSFIIAQSDYSKTAEMFKEHGHLPKPEEFTANHILFPQDAAGKLLQLIT